MSPLPNYNTPGNIIHDFQRAQFWHATFHDVRQDLRSIRWSRVGFWSLVLSWIVGLMSLIVILGLLSSVSSYGLLDSACAPDATFRLEPDTYSHWDSSGFFQITLGVGPLNFSQAKIIDIAWDVLFGRGGQAVLAYVSWKVFADHVSTSMDVKPITYRSFYTIFIQDGPSILSIFSLVRDFAFRQGLHSKIAMTFIVTTMAFVLVFPTLGSAMTGYSSSVSAFIPDANATEETRSLIPFRELEPVLYVVHDGWRINQGSNYYIPADEPSDYDPIIGYCDNYTCGGHKRALKWSNIFYLQNNVSAYVAEHGFYGRKNTTSNFMNQSLEAPVLNISAGYITDTRLFGWNWTDQTGRHPFQNRSSMIWSQNNVTYSLPYIEQFGTCQSTKNYQWGFSFIQLFLMVLLLLFWTIGIYFMWLSAYYNMRARGRDAVAREYKAIVDLAGAMHKGLPTDRQDLQILTEKEIKALVKESNGGRISYVSPISDGAFSHRKRFIAWLREDKWWRLIVVVSVGLLNMIWPGGFLVGMLGRCLACGLLFGVSVGSTWRSRTFLGLASSALVTSVVMGTVLGVGMENYAV
ncbi:hypothetical protein BDV95DRAFT_99821 [Massariosphaeria phaeospora]|uniref:Uncharacterized protein n=1 Tax=Massariosphaeria phaeospora TaxID=100035 RepID=A0A7C8M5S1_9PLEO|nr:hypothetical protein BDV95DRAFT_99821 [Massariosphaeria phaeospora]